MRRKCNACQEETTVEMVLQDFGWRDMSYFQGHLELRPFIREYFSLVSCHREACYMEMRHRYIVNTMLQITEATNEQRKILFLCDQCFLFCEKVHRCGRCLTKQYCSKECKSEDWKEAHEKVCKPGEDPGKIKADRTARNAERDRMAQEFTETQESVQAVREPYHVAREIVSQLNQLGL